MILIPLLVGLAAAFGADYFLSSLNKYSPRRERSFLQLVWIAVESFFLEKHSRRVEFRFLRRKQTTEARREDKQKGLNFYADLRKKQHVVPLAYESASATMAQLFLQETELEISQP